MEEWSYDVKKKKHLQNEEALVSLVYSGIKSDFCSPTLLMETDAKHSAGEQIHKTAELLFSFSTPLCFF